MKLTINPATEKTQPERIQKVLSRLGLGSRREIETWIREGRIAIDGKLAVLGQRVDINSKIRFDGKLLEVKWPRVRTTRVLLYNKPTGEASTRRDPMGRPTVFDRLPPLKNNRWVMVGRLDINTSGLLLFTTNGELANRLMHPSYQIEREYAVRVLGQLDQSVIKRLLTGVTVEDQVLKFDSIDYSGGKGANHWYHVILHEGKYREIRRVFEALGFGVSRLIRVRYGDILLPRYLSRGRCKELTPEEVVELKKSIGL